MKNRSLLMIPGPIEFEPAVMAALAAPTTSHVAPDFIEIFGQALEAMRKVFLCPNGQPFILAGSGTLAMDTAAANLIENGERALVVGTGYFSDRFATILTRYGAQVTQVSAPPGGRPALDEVEDVLKQGTFKLMTVTHVDTSTGVLNDVQNLAFLAKQYGVLCVVDGVCSLAAEDLRMQEWGVDLALTASQKAIGTPPGLALVVAGKNAMAAFRARKTPVASYYSDWNNWLPVMEAYEARRATYFGTPAVNLVCALQVSLEQIVKEGMDVRFERHANISRACKAGIRALGMGQVPLDDTMAAHAMTAPRYRQGIEPGRFLAEMSKAGIIVASGLHPAIKNEYFRIGHMGAVTIGDVLAVLAAVETSLERCGHEALGGRGVQAALQSWQTD